MKILNSFWLAMALAIGFGVLCATVYPRPAQPLTFPDLPASQQPGYSKEESKAMDHFIAFQIKQYADVSKYQRDLGEMYNTKPVE